MFHWTSATPLSAPKSPTLWVPHTPTHHFPSLITGTYFDCYYHIDDDALCDKGVCGPSSFSMQLITKKQGKYVYMSRLIIIAWLGASSYHTFQTLARGELQSCDSGGYLIDWVVVLMKISE